MGVKTGSFTIEGGPGLEITDITSRVQGILQSSGLSSGIACVFVPGSTAGITTTEYEPNLNSDLSGAVERLVPSDISYNHKETWGDDNGKSHVRSSLFKPSICVPFSDSSLMLGRWQNIVLMDFDVPARKREVIVQLVGE